MVARKDLSRKNGVRMVDVDKPTHSATLVLEPGDYGWRPDDVHKTVVVPTSSNFFLTRFINRTHFRGIAVVALHEYDPIPAYEWVMVDFTHDQWYLKEAKCEYGMEVDESLVHNNVYILDVGDTVDLKLRTFLHGKDCSHLFKTSD